MLHISLLTTMIGFRYDHGCSHRCGCCLVHAVVVLINLRWNCRRAGGMILGEPRMTNRCFDPPPIITRPVLLACWVLCPGSIIEVMSAGRRAKTAPLFEEEGHASLQTLITNGTSPFGFHGAKIWTTFPA